MPNPYRTGFADAVLGRECKSPFKGYKQNQSYLAGYLAGKQQMKG
jgi:hypothetical protein